VTGSQRCILDVLLLLTRHDQVLLALRQGTGFADGRWNVPSGKAEPGESAVAAVIREEIGVRLSEDELSFAATVPYNALGVSLYLRKACFGTIGW
jgi:8-oxo-dGTP diphosphatase